MILSLQYIYIYINIIMITKILLIISALTICTHCSCNDELNCFKNKLFNFDTPGQGIYKLNQITNNNVINTLNMMGYGDFNNDLHTDIVGQIKNNTNIGVYIWNNDDSIFILNYMLNATQCPTSSIFLYDMNYDGLLDIVIWGSINGQSCLLPYIHTNSQQTNISFIKGTVLTMPSTSNPFVISYGVDNGPNKSIGLLIYMNNVRSILKYTQANNNFTIIPWQQVFPNANTYASTPFANPHWNSYLDITGDCRADIVIVDSNRNVQFWVSTNENTFSLLYVNNTGQLGNYNALTFNDMNYDGVVDMILAYPTYIKVYYNIRKLQYQTDFCNPQYKSVLFSTQNTIILTFQQGLGNTNNNVLQMKDINIDGYPDFIVPLYNNNNKSIVQIYINNQGQGFATNQQYKLPIQQYNNLISVSFIDFLQNGIIDFIVCTSTGSYAYYNNYLQQNLYYIKGYGASGTDNTKGAQIVGASFYWVNSVGEGYRTALQLQIAQTAYNALQTPFSYCGLGRANNYVQSFTLGIFGQYNSWSPIIPNSQLVVYAPSNVQSEWAIRIYVLPKSSLLYVIIISSIILFVLGVALAILKCKNFRKKEQPLMMEFIH